MAMTVPVVMPMMAVVVIVIVVVMTTVTVPITMTTINTSFFQLFVSQINQLGKLFGVLFLCSLIMTIVRIHTSLPFCVVFPSRHHSTKDIPYLVQCVDVDLANSSHASIQHTQKIEKEKVPQFYAILETNATLSEKDRMLGYINNIKKGKIFNPLVDTPISHCVPSSFRWRHQLIFIILDSPTTDKAKKLSAT
jgi:hypothetical protein